jgi:hypothetical protein
VFQKEYKSGIEYMQHLVLKKNASAVKLLKKE